MKKSFLNRAMAAAIAVPVALSQTVLFASFAEDTVPNSKAITVDTFLDVPVENSAAHPIVEVEKYHVYEISSVWYEQFRAALNSIDGEAPKEIDVKPMIENLGIGKYGSIQEVVKASATGTAQVVGTDVIVVINVNFNDVSKNILEDKVVGTVAGENSKLENDILHQYITTDVLDNTTAKITVKIDTASIEQDKTLKFTVDAVTDSGDITTVDGLQTYVNDKISAYNEELKANSAEIVSYYQAELDKAKAAQDQAKVDELQAQVDDANELTSDLQKLVKQYQDQEESYFKTVKEQMEREVSQSFTRDNYNEVLTDAKKTADDKTNDKSKAGKAVDKVPNSISEAISQNMALKIYTEALNQLGSVLGAKGYTINISLDELGQRLESAYNVSVEDKKVGSEVFGSTTCFIADDITDADKAYYVTYFNELLAADGVTDKEVDTVTTEKKVKIEGNANYDTRTGDNLIDAKRIITITLKDKEEETTESTEDTQDSTEDTQDSTEDTQDSTEDTQDSTEDTQDSTEDTQDSTEDTQDSTEDTQDSTEDTQDSTEDTQDSTEDTQDSTEDTQDSTEDTQDSTEDTQDSTEDTQDSTEDTQDSTEDTQDSTEDTQDSTEDTQDSTEDTQDSTEDTQDSTEDTQDSTEDTQDSTEDTQDSTEDTTPTESDTVPSVKVDDIAFEVDGDVAGNRNFYFSHDPRPFAEDVASLIKKATYTADDMTTKEITLQGNFAFGLTNDLADPTTVSPKSIYDAEGEDATYKYVPLYIYFKNQNGIWEATAEPLVYIYIGVKGDANLDGICNAKDGAAVLVYAADFGAGNEARLTDKTAIGTDLPLAAEAFAWFLADVNEESKDMGATTNRPDDNGLYQGEAVLNSKDAAAIFVYAADQGAGNNPEWGDELAKPLPRFTAAITDWIKAHPEANTQDAE